LATFALFDSAEVGGVDDYPINSSTPLTSGSCSRDPRQKSFSLSLCIVQLEEASTGGELHREPGLLNLEDSAIHFDFSLLFLVSIIHTAITFRIGEGEGQAFDFRVVLVLDRVVDGVLRI
jgi:hypothetical protein